VPRDQQFTRTGRVPDGMIYRKANNIVTNMQQIWNKDGRKQQKSWTVILFKQHIDIGADADGANGNFASVLNEEPGKTGKSHVFSGTFHATILIFK